MSSNKTKQAKKEGLELFPQNVITLKFYSVIKDDKKKDLNTILGGEKITAEKIFTLKVTRLKGFQHTAAFKKMLEAPLSSYYKTTRVTATSRGGEEIPTSLSKLTNGHALYEWMLANGPKLYLPPHQLKTGTVKDRNYAEICLRAHVDDEKQVHKVYTNNEFSKKAKKAEKETVGMIQILVDIDFKSNSPIYQAQQTVEQSLLSFLTPAQIALYQKKLKEETTAKRQLTIANK